MAERRRIVVDTNVLISRLLAPASVPGRATDKELESQLLVSEATLAELAEVLTREKFDPYVTLEERERFFALLMRIATKVAIHHRVQACRDPNDDKFLELAVDGQAACLIIGDRDLLALHPFRGTAILTPSAFLAEEHG
jgi:putative PIN family toxin of toxin-antitoxin system